MLKRFMLGVSSFALFFFSGCGETHHSDAQDPAPSCSASCDPSTAFFSALDLNVAPAFMAVFFVSLFLVLRKRNLIKKASSS